MESVFLGNTGVRVSQLAFGTMSFGSDADEANSRAIYKCARDAGVTHFDTADFYGNGRSEELLGSFCEGHRKDVFLATKAYFPVGDGPNDRGSSRLHLVRAVEASLRRLRTDRIDLFYLHRFDDATALPETLRAVEWLVQRGYVLYPAVSNFAAWQIAKTLGMQELHDWSPVVAVQPMFNLLKRQVEVEILEFAKSENVAVFPYSPTAAGVLTGKYLPTGNIGDTTNTSRINQSTVYKERYKEAGHLEDAIRGFVGIAKELGTSPAALAVAWVSKTPGITSPLLGARNVAQLEDCLGATEINLTDEIYAKITALFPNPGIATDRTEEQTGHGFGKR